MKRYFRLLVSIIFFRHANKGNFGKEKKLFFDNTSARCSLTVCLYYVHTVGSYNNKASPHHPNNIHTPEYYNLNNTEIILSEQIYNSLIKRKYH